LLSRTKFAKSLLVFALSVIIALIAAFALVKGKSAFAAGIKPVIGDGSSQAPYEIGSPAELEWVAENVNSSAGIYYKLLDDIDLSYYNAENLSFNSGKGWIPIGAPNGSPSNLFAGNFDGNGKKITGLYINTNNGFVGLFGGISGSVKNLALEGVEVTAQSHVGGIVGWLTGSVENCYVTGTVSGVASHTFAGGIVGYVAANGSVNNCYSACTVSGPSYVGGIAGFMGLNGSISNCYALGAINASNGRAGGIAGTIHSSADQIKNCVALNISVSGYSTARIACLDVEDDLLLNNYAYEDIQGTFVGGDPDHFNGSGINGNQILSAEFWTDANNWHTGAWDTGIWTIKDSKLPSLFGEEVTLLTYFKMSGWNFGVLQLDSKSNNSITVKAVTAANGQSIEYAINATNSVPESDSSAWQTGLTFSGLNADTNYYIFARAKENSLYESSVSAALTVKTDVSQSNIVPDSGDGNGGLSGGAIASIVIGGILVLALIGFLVYWFVFRKKKQQQS